MNIGHRGSSFINTAYLTFLVPYLIAVDWHESYMSTAVRRTVNVHVDL